MYLNFEMADTTFFLEILIMKLVYVTNNYLKFIVFKSNNVIMFINLDFK